MFNLFGRKEENDSYEYSQVWTLRRYRDFKLAKSVFGRLFITVYYAVSPSIVNLFGDIEWIVGLWKKLLDRKVAKLNQEGYEDSPYDK